MPRWRRAQAAGYGRVLVPRVTVYRTSGEAMTFETPTPSPDDWMTSTLQLQVADALNGLTTFLEVKLVDPSSHLLLTADMCVTTDQLAVVVVDKRDQS